MAIAMYNEISFTHLLADLLVEGEVFNVERPIFPTNSPRLKSGLLSCWAVLLCGNSRSSGLQPCVLHCLIDCLHDPISPLLVVHKVLWANPARQHAPRQVLHDQTVYFPRPNCPDRYSKKWRHLVACLFSHCSDWLVIDSTYAGSRMSFVQDYGSKSYSSINQGHHWFYWELKTSPCVKPDEIH